jgi:hypothetical protein
MKKIRNLILISLIFLSGKCEIPNEYFSLRVRNNFEKQISFYLGDFNADFQYSDTLINKSNITRTATSTASVDIRREWEDVILELPKDTLSIFIFTTDVVKNVSWDKIREDYLVLKRYDLSVDDLKLLEFEVSYPPTPEMANIRQYPPYQ